MIYIEKRRGSTARKQEYNGSTYDSGFEAGYAQELDLRVAGKDIKSWEAQKTLELIVNNYIVCTYRIDFIVYHNDGTIEYVETKGWASPTWRLKWKLFEALYGDKPGVNLTVIKQSSNWYLRKLKKKK